MTRMPRIVAIVFIAAGAFLVVAGGLTYLAVRSQLSDEHITVSDDAAHFGGREVRGPFTAYAQANAIKDHADEIGGGKTYAELPQDDPNRPKVLDASFLRASLYTSVVAFGVGALVVGLGVMFILLGVALLGILRQLAVSVEMSTPTEEPPAPALA